MSKLCSLYFLNPQIIKSVLKKMYIVQKHRIHLKFGCDERFSNYIYKSIIKGKNYHL